jgi:hypothetical protein
VCGITHSWAAPRPPLVRVVLGYFCTVEVDKVLLTRTGESTNKTNEFTPSSFVTPSIFNTVPVGGDRQQRLEAFFHFQLHFEHGTQHPFTRSPICGIQAGLGA